MRGVTKDLWWMGGEARGKALVSVEEIIHSHAVGIDSDNTAIRQWSGLQEHRKRLADLRTTQVYRDDNNNVDYQLQRLVRLQHLAEREIEAGWQPQAVKFHDFLKALASAKMGKQPGSDGVVVEMVRALSWSTLLWLYLLFLVVGRVKDLMLGVR